MVPELILLLSKDEILLIGNLIETKAEVKTSAFVFVIAFLTTLQLTGNF
jgi:hypothetical protein